MAAWRDAELVSGSPTGTVRRKLALLAHISKVARKEWGMESLASPVDSIQLPPPGQARDRRLVGDEQARLLSAATTYGGEIGPIITWSSRPSCAVARLRPCGGSTWIEKPMSC